MSSAGQSLRASQSSSLRSQRSTSDTVTRRRRLFLEQLENRCLLTAIGNGLSAAPDSYTLDEDTTLNVSAPGVLSNDAGTSATQLSSPQNGSLSFSPDGSFSYTPIADFYGTDSFTYQATEGSLFSDEITVTLTINDVPEPAPVAVDDYFQIDEDTSLSAGVLGNDQGQSLSASAYSFSTFNGSVSMNSDGTFTYTPATNFHGTDSFLYWISDGTNTDEGQVIVEVAPVNDAPVAADASLTVNEDEQLFVYSGWFNSNADPEGVTPSIANMSQPAHGTISYDGMGSFIYTPEANYFGPDSLTYQLTDGELTSNIATITFDVQAVNDPAVAADDAFTMAEDEYSFSASLVANDYDIDGPYLSANLVSNVCPSRLNAVRLAA